MSEYKCDLMELTEWDVRLMAWHEAGHAVCCYFMPESEMIESVSIEPGNDAFGSMRTVPRKKRNLTYISCLGEIAIAMSGRLSEQIFQKEITSSCIHDLEKIQAIAMRMVCEYGMGKRTGLIAWTNHAADSSDLMLFSEKQRNDIYEDVRKILNDAEEFARKTLEDYRQEVGKVAEALLTRKTLSFDDLYSILGPAGKKENGITGQGHP